MINSTLGDQKYILLLNNVKNKVNIVKIRTNSHKIQSEKEHWIVPKTSWDEIIFPLCDTKRVEYENCFLVECSV